MWFKIIFMLSFFLSTIALKAQDFRYKLNRNFFIADSRAGIELISSDSTGYLIYVKGNWLTDKHLSYIYKLDNNFNISDSILVPKPMRCTVQKFFKTNDGIGWFHDYFDSDKSLRIYEVTQLGFGKVKPISVIMGNIENWQSNLARVVGCNLGFSTNQKMVYTYLWKEKPRSEKGWVSEVTILDMDFNLIIKSSLPEEIGAGDFWNGNAILDRDTTFYSIKQNYDTNSKSNSFRIKPLNVVGLNLQTWHVPSGKITNFEVKGINQGINHAKVVYDNNQKLHFAGFYTSVKNFYAKGFFDYIISDKKELSLLNEHFFTNAEFAKLEANGYNPAVESGKEFGLKEKYKIEKINFNPVGFYDYIIESFYFTENQSAVMPLGGGFIGGMIAGAAMVYLDEYSVSKSTWFYEPAIMVRKPIANTLYSLSMLPTAQRSQNSNAVGIYQFDFKEHQYFISNESKQNSKKSISKWDYFSRFTDNGQSIITTFDHDNTTLIRMETVPLVYNKPAIVNVRQIVRLNEKEFFVVVKPDGTSSEHYLGKLIIK